MAELTGLASASVVANPLSLLLWAADAARGQRRLRRRARTMATANPSAATPPPAGEERFRVLYDELWDDLRAYCSRRCASETDADDVLAETFTVAWRRLEDVPNGSAARPWLFGVARNLLREQYRRGDWVEGVTGRLINELVTHLGDDLEATEAQDDLDVAVQALHLLAEPDRELISLIAWEELSHADAAVVLGCSTNAVAIRLHRARLRLEAKVAELNATPDEKKMRKP